MLHKLTLIWRLMLMIEPYQVAGNWAEPATDAEAVLDSLGPSRTDAGDLYICGQ